MAKPQLIVVDDEKEMAEIVAHAGTMVGFESEIMTSAKELQEVWPERQPDVIVLDVMMPDVDGFDLLSWLSKQNCTVPIVIISGHDPMFLELAADYGEKNVGTIVGTLSKPFSIDELKVLLLKAVA